MEVFPANAGTFLLIITVENDQYTIWKHPLVAWRLVGDRLQPMTIAISTVPENTVTWGVQFSNGMVSCPRTGMTYEAGSSADGAAYRFLEHIRQLFGTDKPTQETAPPAATGRHGRRSKAPPATEAPTAEKPAVEPPQATQTADDDFGL